jgi:hypothetical protein
MNNQYKDISLDNIKKEMTETYKKIPVIIKKNKDGEITKTIYPVYYNIQKAKHLENYKNVINKIFYKALQKRFTDPVERYISTHIYDTYYTEYKFDINDLSITKEYGEENRWIVNIDNDRWSVSYYIEIQKYGNPLKARLAEYVEENICYFQPHFIWIHLEGKVIQNGYKEESTFEDTDTKCPICLEDYDEDKECEKLQNCGHKYCVDCIDQVIEYGSCSICRETTDTHFYNEDPITKEDIENLCEDGDSETLIEWLKEFDEWENFLSYTASADGYTHTLGYESGTDIELTDGEYILMCRLDAYEKKTPINPYYN